jgi:membrane associated rhomboid family serine protease
MPEPRPARTGLRFDGRDWPVTLVTCIAAMAVTGIGHRYELFDLFALDHRAFGAEPWRFLSATLLHGDALHLLSNVFLLSLFGAKVEKRIGSAWTLALSALVTLGASAGQYLASGIGGIGLSDLVYAWFGLLFVQTFVRRLWPREIGATFALIFLVLGIASIGKEYRGARVADVAHGIGFLMGMFAALPCGAVGAQRVWRSAPLASGFGACVLAGWISAEADMRSRAWLALTRAADAEERGDLEESWREARLALDLGGLAAEDQSVAWLHLADAESGTGRLGEAGRSYLRAFELAPHSPDARAGIRWWLEEYARVAADQIAAGLSAYRERVPAEGLDAAEAHVVGWLYRAGGDLEQAREMLRRAVHAAPFQRHYFDVLHEVECEQYEARSGR